MRPIAPRTGGEEVTFGGSDEFLAITVAVHLPSDMPGLVTQVTRWQPTAEERQRLAAGEDVYVGILQRPGPITPHFASVGPGPWSRLDAPR